MPRTVKTREDRLEWLKQRPELWQDVKLVPLNGGAYNYFIPNADHHRIVAAMKAAGMLAQSTYYLDVQLGKYIRTLRGLR